EPDVQPTGLTPWNITYGLEGFAPSDGFWFPQISSVLDAAMIAGLANVRRTWSRYGPMCSTVALVGVAVTAPVLSSSAQSPSGVRVAPSSWSGRPAESAATRWSNFTTAWPELASNVTPVASGPLLNPVANAPALSPTGL